MLLDNRFPFSNGEPFLENEIAILAESFDKVYIIPTNSVGGDISKKLCENTIVYSNSFSMTKAESACYLMKAVFSCKVLQEILDLKQNKQLHIKEAKRLVNFWHLADYRCNQILKWMKSNRIQAPDIIYSYWADINLLTAVLLQTRIKKGCVVSRAHGHDLYLERNDGYLPLRKYLFQNSTRIFAVSEQGTQYLKARFPMFSEKYMTSYLGTLDAGLSQRSEDDILRVVSCSNIVELKRIDRIIDALASIEDIEVEWHHFGDGPMMKQMVDYAASKLSKGHYFFHGRLDNRELLAWYSKNPVDVFVNVSTTEGLPVSIMEAMSFGIPVIATDVGGTSEIVNDRVNGYLLSSDFKDMELRDAIVKIASLSEEDSKSLRIEARNTWTKKFSAVSNYKAFYKTICDYAH